MDHSPVLSKYRVLVCSFILKQILEIVVNLILYSAVVLLDIDTRTSKEQEEDMEQMKSVLSWFDDEGLHQVSEWVSVWGVGKWMSDWVI